MGRRDALVRVCLCVSVLAVVEAWRHRARREAEAVIGMQVTDRERGVRWCQAIKDDLLRSRHAESGGLVSAPYLANYTRHLEREAELRAKEQG